MGSGPARNACWEDSIERGAKRHWILDDNIQDFYRLHQNFRYRVKSPTYFRIMEDFVERTTCWSAVSILLCERPEVSSIHQEHSRHEYDSDR